MGSIHTVLLKMSIYCVQGIILRYMSAWAVHASTFVSSSCMSAEVEEEEPGEHHLHSHIRGQRQYEFAVEVTAGPPNSVFRHTKVITVKSKYIVENETGMPIEIKQRGTPDLDVQQYGSTAQGRCARRLEVNERRVATAFSRFVVNHALQTPVCALPI